MIKCTFLGDIMCTEEIIQAFKKENGYNFDAIFDSTKSLFEKSDFIMGNLETPISIDNKKLTNEKYRFNSPFEFAEAVKKAGIDAVATANNHCLDRGIEGIKSTQKSLDKIGLIHTGCLSQEKAPTIISVGGGGKAWPAFLYIWNECIFQS